MEKKVILRNAIKHIKLVSKHKWVVFKLCCKVGIPWRGLVHDLSKFSFTEFSESVKYYTGTHSPIRECRKINGYSKAWIHHKNKNKHHFEYWIDMCENLIPVVMPYKYAAEMVCDRIAAGIVYMGKDWSQDEPLKYFLKEKDLMIINEKMKEFLEAVFIQVRDNGIDKTLKKKNIKGLYKKYCEN